MLRRLVKVLALPIIALIFFVGWVLYCVGGKKDSLRKKPAQELVAVGKQEEPAAVEGIETGLIGEGITVEYQDQ